MSGGRAGCGQIIVLPRIVVEYEVGRSGVGLWGAEGGQWRTQNEGGGSDVVLAKRLLLREWEGSGRLVLSIVDGRSERAACLTTEDPPPRPPNGKGKATQGATAARRSAPKRALCQPPAIPTGLTLKERGQLAQEQPLDFFFRASLHCSVFSPAAWAQHMSAGLHLRAGVTVVFDGSFPAVAAMARPLT